MSAPNPANFDRLARFYRALEFLAFGRDLERARFCFLPELAGCRSILVLGEGDGRCLARLVRLAPEARIDCIDLSPAMLARAGRRLEGTGGAERVRFIQGDALARPVPEARYDAVVTFFFLDCFTTPEVETIARRISAGLLPGARWLFADFVLPPRGWRRCRARVWVAVLYAFFHWETRLSTRSLPASEAALAAEGWRPERIRDFQQGLVRSAIFRRG